VLHANIGSDNQHGRSSVPELVGQVFPHLPRTAFRVLELGYKSLGFRLLVWQKGVADRSHEREATNPLRGPNGANRGTGYTPDFLGIGFEENFVKALAEAVGDPLFENHLLRTG